MTSSIRNLLIISVTAFIVSCITTNVEGHNNTSSNSELVPISTVDWHVVKSKSKNFYIQTYFVADWFTAMEYCHFHGMHLASINDNVDDSILVEEFVALGFKDDSHFWTSGNDLSVESHFVWLGNGQKFRYNNWHEGEPNDLKKDEDCVEYMYKDSTGFKWNDENCNKKFYFVCEYKAV